jgi:hypothetical protein
MLVNKETLIQAAALGAGAVTAKVVQKKVVPMVLPTASPTTQNLITLAAGIFTPTIIRGNIGAAYGAGMIAASVAGLIDPFLAKAGIAGVGEVMLGEAVPQDSPLMGSADVFSSASNDTSYAAGGEMDY